MLRERISADSAASSTTGPETASAMFHTAIPGSTNEQRLDLGQRDMIKPAIGVQSNVIHNGVDQDAAHARLVHQAEGDLHRPSVGVGMGDACIRSRHLPKK